MTKPKGGFLDVWTLLVWAWNIFVLAALAALWIRFKRPPQEDPRLSRGLQLLQSKISVLEDLSDRTDIQVKQLSSLLDRKSLELQEKVLECEQTMKQLEGLKKQSEQTALMLQDRVPHEEVIERKNTVKMVKAALMAKAGKSAEEISKTLKIAYAEAELIAKLNCDELLFNDQELPDWIKMQSLSLEDSEESVDNSPLDLKTPLVPSERQPIDPEVPKEDPRGEIFKDLSEKFQLAQKNLEQAAETMAQVRDLTAEENNQNQVRKFEFRRITVNSPSQKAK